MNKKIVRYLEKMSKKIRNKAARERAREEIYGHILDQMEDYQQQGKTYAESVEITLRQATSPQKLGRKLNLAHRPWLFRYPLIAATVQLSGISALLLIIVSHYVMSEGLRPSVVSLEKGDAFYERFQQDLEIIGASSYKEYSRKRNAHGFLIEKVG